MPDHTRTLELNSTAPDFRLPAAQGGEYALDDLLAGRRSLALIFLRGTW